MRRLFILILSTCFVYANGQTDTLSADKINFEFLGQKGDDLENVGLVVRLIAHYEADKPAFHKLKLNHQHGSNYMSSTTYDLNLTKNKIGHDTVILHVRQELVPGDKFVLEYFQNPKFKKEFKILSTVSSNRKPYYTDIVFVYNGDTVNTSGYRVSSLYLAQKSISKIDDKVLRISTHTLTEFNIEFKNKLLSYELRTDVIYHKFVIAGYFDNIKVLENRVQKTKEYSNPIKFMKEYGLKKIRSLKIIDADNKREVSSQYSQEW